MPILTGELTDAGIETGDELVVDFAIGEIENKTKGKIIKINPFSEVQMDIYKRGGLLGGGC